ncbi:hypothetical protein PPTG_23222 [Phytophthora nicotianae INRA-310]|uniref:Uncharacterized protein n=1 Tax=Phytophthora nicotianae (strain INRA-310) TaxID=761204 RepID=W2Q2L3_PHYN3|nr:hypothetical protein PPTG_23222 [Phytophthora nicotianae INRA-310]ETN07121.1 hypothetical protein PPTG_23222 [Phytophthora nicotianae INRA-310]
MMPALVMTSKDLTTYLSTRKQLAQRPRRRVIARAVTVQAVLVVIRALVMDVRRKRDVPVRRRATRRSAMSDSAEIALISRFPNSLVQMTMSYGEL